MRALIAVLSIAMLALVGCSDPQHGADSYGATTAKLGDSVQLLGWNISLSNLRWDSGHALVDVDASPSERGKPHAKPEDMRFGLYGTLAHAIEADGLGSCKDVASLSFSSLSAPNPDRLTGTVCLGPIDNQSAVRGVYVYSSADRIPETTAAYPVAFPLGLLPTNRNDTGVTVKSTNVEAWRADGTMLNPQSLGDNQAFTGNGYMILGLNISAIKAQYGDVSSQHGGPMMVLVGPTLPPDKSLSHTCAIDGSSVLVLPDTKLDAVQVNASLCTQGEINAAVLYATLSLVGTHAAVWVSRD